MSTASSELSQSSSDTDSREGRPVARRIQRQGIQERLDTAASQNILLSLIAFRILNALCVRTFFQPDEFFQSLEPAWQLAFGKDSGAWITWEWTHHLRSSIHPILFAAVYYVADILSWCLRLSPLTRAEVLVVAPKITQAIIAAVGDYYTWKLAGKVYGQGSNEAWAVRMLTVVSPWQWFCSTRTLSNCLETTLTVVALYFWPWRWTIAPQNNKSEDEDDDDLITNSDMNEEPEERNESGSLRKCLLLAALACVLRPTNIIIWITLAGFMLSKATRGECLIIAREATIWGSCVLGFSIFVDSLYYGTWTFPPLKFLYFNIAQSLAVFYGRNDWHYYISQGFPLLLITALPFGLVGLYQAVSPCTRPHQDHAAASIKRQLGWVCIIMPSVLSLISHKEVRFIYPLLPCLHVLTAPPFLDCFLPAIASSSAAHTPRRLILLFLLLVNVTIALYTTLTHASGVIDVLSYLRGEHEAHYQAQTQPPQSSLTPVLPSSSPNMTVGFLMPCHSTPWRSNLVFPSIRGWALSCEPPVGLNQTQKAAYLDEADQFYANPSDFLRANMVGGLRHIPRRPSYLAPFPSLQRPQELPTTLKDEKGMPRFIHEWPDYLIFFAQLEPTMQSLLRGSSYGECWRTFNTAWHDDWRRRGDIVVWCLDPKLQQDSRDSARKKEQARRDKQFDKIVETFRRQGRPQKSWWQWPSWSYSGLHWPRAWPFSKQKRSIFELPSDWFSRRNKKTNFLSDLKLPSWPFSSKKKKKSILDRELWE
ncbi:CAZyme family GT22 [Paecilomyces variotii]|nr:CAZyme family GT22 [Paecilomyces variotii]KAJ9327977.1 CAZyme family GT22 [Paecilomyces variotii]